MKLHTLEIDRKLPDGLLRFIHASPVLAPFAGTVFAVSRREAYPGNEQRNGQGNEQGNEQRNGQGNEQGNEQRNGQGNEQGNEQTEERTGK